MEQINGYFTNLFPENSKTLKISDNEKLALLLKVIW